jgi:tyrosyl-DNA phosphodiesterase 2
MWIRSDVWADLNPGDDGYTYDGRRNPMLGPTNKLRSRLDRVMVKLADWKAASIVMVGKEPIIESNQKEAVYCKESRKGLLRLPLLPSDHFGLYAKFVPR